MAAKITKEDITYLKSLVVSFHDRCIEKSGGLLGLLSGGNLEFVIYDILKFSVKHEDPLLIAAYIYEVIATRHCFSDGNKRTAHIFAKHSLFVRDIHLKLHYEDACPFILEIAQCNKTLKEIHIWLQKYTKKFEKKDRAKYLRDLINDIEYAKKDRDTQNDK